MPGGTMLNIEQTSIILNAAIGKPYSESLREELSQLTGRPVRPMGFGFAGTADHRPERVSLKFNEDLVVHSYDFG
jgi:hypothetical protein